MRTFTIPWREFYKLQVQADGFVASFCGLQADLWSICSSILIDWFWVLQLLNLSVPVIMHEIFPTEVLYGYFDFIYIEHGCF